jgi:protein disulfide isomerase family A protein 3
MRSQVGPASKELKSVSDFESFIAKDDTAVVAFYAEKDSKLEKTFQKVTDKLREKSRFGHSSNKDILKKASQKADTLVLYRPKNLNNKFEPSSVAYEGAFDTEDIQKWIEDNYHGLVGVRTQDSSKDFKQPIVIAYYNVDYKKNAKGKLVFTF